MGTDAHLTRKCSGPKQRVYAVLSVGKIKHMKWPQRCSRCWRVRKRSTNGLTKCHTVGATGHTGGWQCPHWALSVVKGQGGQAAADEVCKPLTEGDMMQPPESWWARQVMREARVRTWEQYQDKVRTGEISRGAGEVGLSAHQIGCKIALHREPGAKGLYGKMANVDEVGRAAAALLWSRRGGGH